MIIFDLDGTLSLVGNRVKYLEQFPKDWDSFYESCTEDKVNKPIQTIFQLFRHRYSLKIVTGRRESTREKTLIWLADNDMGIHTEDLIMRPNNNYRHDTILKLELVKDFITEIEMVFEDRNSMVIKWRELGITCLQVAEGNF